MQELLVTKVRMVLRVTGYYWLTSNAGIAGNQGKDGIKGNWVLLVNK